MNALRIERVLELPEKLTPSTMYLIQSEHEGMVDIVFSNMDGTRRLEAVNKSLVTSMITNTMDNFENIHVVDTIEDRDELDLDRNALVLVTHGDDDESRSATLYIYSRRSAKYIELLTLSVEGGVSIRWSDILGGPQSSPEDIDEAVTKAHSHDNSEVLDDMGVDGEGNLLFRQKHVGSVVSVSEW